MYMCKITMATNNLTRAGARNCWGLCTGFLRLLSTSRARVNWKEGGREEGGRGETEGMGGQGEGGQ